MTDLSTVARTTRPDAAALPAFPPDVVTLVSEAAAAPALDGVPTFPVHDPATGEVLALVADQGPADAIRALDRAVAAADEWAATPPRVRGETLRRAFDLLVERRESFALLMSLEMGKPLAEARGEVAYGG